MDLGDYFYIGSMLAFSVTFMVLLHCPCCFSEMPREPQHAVACARLTFNTCTEKEGGDGGCVICLGEYLAGERRTTIPDCEHRFHAVCIALAPYVGIILFDVHNLFTQFF